RFSQLSRRTVEAELLRGSPTRTSEKNHSPGRSANNGEVFFPGSEIGPFVPVEEDIGAAIGTAGFDSWRAAARSSHLPKIILPAVVCNTEVTAMSTVLPIILRALSTTTIVPS